MPLRGCLTFPGDKSLSHRAAILATLARGKSTLHNFLDAEDTLNTLKAMQALGAKITDLGSNSFLVESPGLAALQSPAGVIDCGNSGTGSRLILGLIAGLPGVTAVIDGDSSLRKRPMRRVAEPLEKLGARFEWLSEVGFLPVRVTGTALPAIHFTEKLGSAQVKSAVILAAIASQVPLTLDEPIASRDHTENMLRFAGVAMEKQSHGSGFRLSLKGGELPEPREYKIWGDISSAAFFAVGASLLPGSELLLRGVLLNPYRERYLHVLRAMGAAVEILPQRDACGEKGGDILVRHAPLHGVAVAPEDIPALIDELPILTIAGVFAAGRFSYRNAKELRVKESDRIAIMAENLRQSHVHLEEFEDGLVLEGDPARPLTGTIRPEMDHRIVMSFEIADLVSRHIRNPQKSEKDLPPALTIEGRKWVATSFPAFYEKLDCALSYELVTEGIKPRVITIDGPAGSGKSTVAYMVAKSLGYNQIDSGALYRAFTWAGYREYLRLQLTEDWASAVSENSALRSYLEHLPIELSFGDDGRQLVFVDGVRVDDELRSPEVAARIKPVADAVYLRARVRSILLAAAERFSLIADGRDMGTEVFTDAPFKFFLTANSSIRAERRLAEFREKNPTITLDEVKRQIEQRDFDDQNRAVGALKPAPEAIFIDTSSHTQEQVADLMLAYIRNMRVKN